MTKQQKASKTINSDESATQSILNDINETAAGIINMIALSAILTAINPILLFVITALTLVQHGIHRAGNYWDYKHEDKWALFYRKLGYIDNISGDFERAKDIRLYNLKTWLRDIFSAELRKYIKWEKTAEKHAYVFFDVSYAVIYLLICNGISFAYLIINVLNASITIADAVFYFSAIGAFTNALTGIMFSIRELNKNSLSICHLREFLDIADYANRDAGIELPASAPEIEFKNVSFTYPKADCQTLKNISFTIKKGERVAIVGRNGAGKTTLVKLLTGLYRTSEGVVLINGNEINKYNRDKYYTLISAVFQDIYLFPVSISQNIALCEENTICEDKLTASIQFAGLDKKIDSLPKKHDTLLLKSVVENAIELSGGEKQKLALARALYKDGLLLILDEPTAALDPIAENEIYLQYNQFAQDKTSIFISHRLSSTRFCDRILFLEDGKITESGSHDDLMKLNGKYAEIFNIQSYYYREGINREES
jgi:ABC-type multidrug transport system fused ATPase/permease subunit